MEWAKLKSTLIALHNNRFLCDHCLTLYPARPKLLEKERRVKGCWDIYSDPIHKFDGIAYKTCPGNYYDNMVCSWVEAADSFDKGVMPFPGSYFDQPAKAIEVLRIIKTYKTNYQLERAREKAARQKPQVKHGR